MTTPETTLLAKTWITRENYLARRHLDEDHRAVLMTYTHGTGIAIDEDDLQQALADAAAALAHAPDNRLPELPQYPPLETVLAMMDLAALHWTPRVEPTPSRWHGPEGSARNMLALAHTSQG